MFKKFAVFLCFALTAGAAMTGFDEKNVYAANLVLTGDTQGLTITPQNEDLFIIDNMLPGESATSGIQIYNTDSYPFSLSVEVKNMKTPVPDEPDLLDVITITVSMNDQEITNFPAKGGSYNLGRFIPNQIAELDIFIELSGSDTGNDYQMTATELQWVFTAISEYTELPLIPPPGGAGGGGGGGGGGFTSSVVTIPANVQIPAGVPAEAPVMVELLEDQIPLGAIEDELVELPEEQTPLGSKEMPKTGEISLVVYVLAGILIMSLGIALLIKQHGDNNLE